MYRDTRDGDGEYLILKLVYLRIMDGTIESSNTINQKCISEMNWASIEI